MSAPAAGMRIQGLWFLAPREALEALRQGALLVDLRSDELVGMKAFDVPEQVHIAHGDLASAGAGLPRERLLVLADSSGVYVKGAAATLGTLGFERIACLNGGMLAWDEAGLPLATDPAALLHGECACVMRPRKGPSRNVPPDQGAAMELRARTPEDLPAVSRLLEAAALPADGLERTEGWVVQLQGRVVAHVALELTPDAAVLRSLVVDPALRGQGLARRLMDAAEARAGGRTRVLKSETIGPWVERRGYVRATREQIPASVLGTTQFEGALCSCCPIYFKPLIG